MTVEKKSPYHIHDWVQKFLFAYGGQIILNIFNIPYTYKSILNSEIIVDGFKTFRVDVIFETYEGVVVIIEFQSGKPDFKKRHQFLKYIHETYISHDKRVELYVVCNDDIKNDVFRVEFNKGDFYPVNVRSLKKLNADKIIDVIWNKIRNNEKISKREIIELIFSCYASSQKTTEEIFIDVAVLFNQFDIDKVLNTIEIKIFKQILEFLSLRLVGEEFQEQFKQVLNMATSLYEDGEKKGIIKGESNATKRIIKNMGEKGLSNEDISMYTNIPLDEVEKFI